MTAEEMYFTNNHEKYTANLEAHSHHEGRVLRRQVCAIFVGSTPIPPATREGTPACG